MSAPVQLCASEMTEQVGGDLAFAAPGGDGELAVQDPVMLRPHVRVLKGGSAAVASCERPRGAGLTGGGGGALVQETRVWEMQDGRWKCVHCHTSPWVEGKPSSPSR